jgi:competence protein ComEA
MNNTWREWFVFTKKERTGILVLVIIILFATCAPWFFSAHFSGPDTAVTKQLQAELLRLHEKADSINKRSLANDDDRNMARYDVPVGNKPATLFEFDPNTLPAEGWKKLGLRERSIQTIRKYVERGGKFRQPADLKKIYGLREEDANRLMPYVRIQSHEMKKPVYEAREYPKYKKPEPRLVDINTADTAALIALPGIGAKLAQRIINFRDKLGGFHSVEQVKETYGLPDSTFQLIRSWMQCSPAGIARIDINTADMNMLAKHPYIGRNLANAIVRFREQHGPYKSLEDLQKIVLVTPEIFKKIVQYLAVPE